MKKYSSILTTVSIVLALALSLSSCTPKMGCYNFSQTSHPKTPGFTNTQPGCEETLAICSSTSDAGSTTIENHKAVSN